PHHDITIILTDTNATLSISDQSTGSPVGTTFADRFTNDNAYPILDMVQPRWQNQESAGPYPYLLTNCRVYRGAELGNTDHRLLVAHLKLKLRAYQHTKTLPRLDSSLLSDPNIATDFSCAIHHTFDNLAKDKADRQTFKESIIQSAHNVFGHF
ncbi:transient receptor potential cation channel subfamily V member 1-like, partial [Tachysurus ichikawai]